MKEKKLFNPSGNMMKSEFFISIPNIQNKNVQLDDNGRFSYDYKYGRREGEIQEYVKVVPFSRNNISEETLDRFRISIPETYKLVEEFTRSNPKTDYLKETSRIKK